MTLEDVLEVVIPALLLGGGVLFAVAVWHFARALGMRIRRWGERPALAREPSVALLGELETLHREMTELSERVDFAERMLAQQRDAQRVGPGQ
ncbi:MAG: hypothetical protein ACREMR_12010 [Gemmatimonadales bacterium]